MCTVLDEPAHRAPRCRATTAHDDGRRAGVPVLVRDPQDSDGRTESRAAEPFGTDARFLSAGKRLLDISHPAYKAVTAVRGKVDRVTGSR